MKNGWVIKILNFAKKYIDTFSKIGGSREKANLLKSISVLFCRRVVGLIFWPNSKKYIQNSVYVRKFVYDPLVSLINLKIFQR